MASSLSPLGAVWLGGGCFPLLPARESCGRRQMAPLHLAAQVKEGKAIKVAVSVGRHTGLIYFFVSLFSGFSFGCLAS